MSAVFDYAEARAVLHRTPATLDALLRGMPKAWTEADEGPDTFSAFEVVGHLLHGESTDWLPRIRRLLDEGTARAFEPFDRFAHRQESEGRSLEDLLDDFAARRAANLRALEEWEIGEAQLGRRGLHPSLGEVTLAELLAAWVVHDLDHLAQIARVMARRYGSEVGPWAQYLRLLRDPDPSEEAG